MKINISVDLDDWNCEDDNLKDFIEKNIINAVSDKVTKQIFNDVYINASCKITDQVDVFINKVLAEFLDRRITVTDKWGNKVEEHENVTELLQKKFDDFMTGAVDRDGKPVKKGCSYRGQDSRIVYMIDKAAKHQIDKFINNITGTVDNRINALLRKSLQEELSDTMFKHIDVKKLLRGF